MTWLMAILFTYLVLRLVPGWAWLVVLVYLVQGVA